MIHSTGNTSTHVMPCYTHYIPFYGHSHYYYGEKPQSNQLSLCMHERWGKHQELCNSLANKAQLRHLRKYIYGQICSVAQSQHMACGWVKEEVTIKYYSTTENIILV